LWAKRVTGPADSLDEGTDVAVTAKGSVYVAGAVGGHGTNLDFVVIKYAKNGHELWRRASDGSAHDRDCANALTLDGAGNVYAAGVMYSAGHGQDLALAKYSPSGHRRWLRTWNGPNDQEERAQDVAVSGHAVTAVGFGDGVGLPQKAIIASYSLSGQLTFAAVIDPAGPFSSCFDDVAVDRSGHIVAGGWIDQGAGGGADMWLMRMDPGGAIDWSLPITGWASEDERIDDVAVTRTGTVYACGAIATPANGTDAVAMRLTRGGVYRWWGQYESAGDDGAVALSVSRNAVYVAGEVGAPAAVFKYKR